MVKQKSRRKQRIHSKTPSGRIKITYKERKPAAAVCASCGVILKGVARVKPCKLRNIAKSKKRPERPYGGVLCSGCARRKFILKARSQK